MELRLPSSDEALMIHFEPEVAAQLSIDRRVAAGGLGGLGLSDTGGGTVAVVKLTWAWTKDIR